MRTDPAAAALSQALDVSNERHVLLSENLANLNTPGYQRVDLDFEGALQDPSDAPQAHVVRGGAPNLDHEVGAMTSTDTYYEACAKLLQLRYQLLHSSVKER
jgi:flagellar basal-body rod protein FlgB